MAVSERKRSNFERLLAVGLSLPLLAHAPAALACPAYLEAKSLSPLPPAARESLRMFTVTENGKGERIWESQPVQIDPMEATPFGSVLAVPEEGADQDKEMMAKDDRIALRVEAFGPPASPKDPAPCKTERLYELESPAAPGKFAYLAACDDPTGKTRTEAPDPVEHDRKKRHMETALYDYDYLANNQLIFKRFSLHDPKTKKSVPSGKDADILLHLDVKKFFTIDLTNEGVQSFVEHSRNGELGLVGRIQFYLKLLFFKIDMKMATTGSWFTDAAHLPMVMDVPLDASDRLHSGSGMLFNWDPQESRFLPESKLSSVPIADPKLITGGLEALAAVGLKNCQAGAAFCAYRMEGRVGTQDFYIDMSVPHTLVKRGFFPSFVPNVASFKKGVEWDDEPDAKDEKRIAMYFETAGLPKGQHKMDYWIRMGDGSGKLSVCPQPVAVRRSLSQGGQAPVAH